MLRDARRFLMTAAALVLACSSNNGPSCNEPQQCVYSSQGAGVCRQSCNGDAAACPSGQVCSAASACCGGGSTPLVPSNQCSSPPVSVCCPVSGC
jgi:hypothetical protein